VDEVWNCLKEKIEVERNGNGETKSQEKELTINSLQVIRELRLPYLLTKMENRNEFG